MQDFHAARPWLVVDNSSSSDNWTPRSGAKRSIFKCSREGTIPRSRHLRLASTLTPNSAASGSMRSQRSMPASMDILSGLSRTTSRVTNSVAERHCYMSDISKKICQRTRDAREDTGRTQPEMALLLGMTSSAYAKNETRNPIRSFRVQLFCELTQKDPAWLLTGDRWPDQKHKEPIRSRKSRKTRKPRKSA